MTSSDMRQMEPWWRTGQQGWQRVVGAWQRFQQLWRRVEQLWQRSAGVLLLAGGVLATVGWLTASITQNPLSGAWTSGVWEVIVGAVLVLLGMMGLYAQHMLRAGMVGLYGLLFLFGGTLLLIVGAAAVDLILLPKLFQAISHAPDLTSQVQNVVNGAQQAANTVSTGGSTACNAVANFFGAGNCTSSPSQSTVPSVTIPPLNGATFFNGLLSLMGLPTLAGLGSLGLSLLSGAFLAPGCLILAVSLLWAGFRPRWAMLGLMGAALLSLASQFGLKVPFVGHSGGVLFFLAVAIFGALLSFPGRWRIRLPDQLRVAGLAHEVGALGQAAFHAVQAIPGTPRQTKADAPATSPPSPTPEAPPNEGAEQ